MRRLEPSIDTITHRLKRSRDAVVWALANLRTHRFLDWIRRYERTEAEGRGPKIRQATNAYRLSLPEHARQLLGWRGHPPSPPEDHEHAHMVRAVETETYRRSLPLVERALFDAEDGPLTQALARLGRNVERESARQAESRSEYIKPAPD